MSPINRAQWFSVFWVVVQLVEFVDFVSEVGIRCFAALQGVCWVDSPH